MGNIGIPEIALIALIALLLFGAGRIADIGKGLGQGIKNFKQGLKEAEEVDADRNATPNKELPAAPAGSSSQPSKGDQSAKA